MVQHYATSNTFYDGERGAVMPRLHPNYIYMPSSSIHATSIKYLVRGFHAKHPYLTQSSIEYYLKKFVCLLSQLKYINNN